MPTALPHQIVGAEFLAARNSALLADAPRVGKTGAAVMACDLVDALSVLIITTASNRLNFARDVDLWQRRLRTVSAVVKKTLRDPGTDVVVVPWSLVAAEELRCWLRIRKWDVLIIDEAHYAKTPATARTIAVFGADGLHAYASRVWLLTGTPIPNSPLDLWPALRALEPKRLDAGAGSVNVFKHSDFRDRYCTWYPRVVSGRRIEIITGGKNEDELRERLAGWWLRRTQADVGITPPQYDLLLLPCSKVPREALDFDMAAVLEAAEAGDSGALEMELATLRRLTGAMKAKLVADVVREEFACGLDAVVLMCWHREVITALAEALSQFGVVCLSGSTTPQNRQAAQDDFQAGRARVFIGQMQAAGEAINLSAAAELIFVEQSFVPKDMAQAALRITNHGQKRTPRVRAAVLAGSIDEKVTAILLRKVTSIKAVWSDQ